MSSDDQPDQFTLRGVLIALVVLAVILGAARAAGLLESIVQTPLLPAVLSGALILLGYLAYALGMRRFAPWLVAGGIVMLLIAAAVLGATLFRV